jgi:peroxiredoxin
MFCRQQLGELQALMAQEPLPRPVAVVTMGSPAQTAAFVQRGRDGFRVACDPRRGAYRAFGVPRAGLEQALRPQIAIKMIEATAKGYLPGVPQADVAQLPAAFVIDSGGAIRHAHYARDASDHMPAERLAAAIRSLDRLAQ